jgi:hypothetical protein
MSFLRVILAAIAGGIVVFMWGAFTHMTLRIGDMGNERIPNEAAVMKTLDAALQGRGLYIFPGMDEAAMETDPAVEQAWQEAYRTGPRGVLIYDDTPDVPAMLPKMLAVELGADVIAALLAAIILTLSTGNYFVRAVLVGLMGIFAWLCVDISWWNWFRVPDSATLFGLIDQGAGWLLAGFAMAGIARPARGGAAVPSTAI